MPQQPGRELIYWEDVPVGVTTAFGSHRVTREEIIDFARTYDPQPFHIDDEAARALGFDRLIAPGWHACGMMMRLLAENVLNLAAALGSPGVDECRWLKPVFAGDQLSCSYTCLSKRELKSRPGVGLCQMQMEMINQSGETVMTWKSAMLMRVRHPGASLS